MSFTCVGIGVGSKAETETMKGKKVTRLAKQVCEISAIVGVSCASLLCGAEPILLKAGTIHPEETITVQSLKISSFSAQEEDVAERGLYIVQHDGLITPGWRAQIEQAGAIIRGYIPENAYLIEASRECYLSIVSSVDHAYIGDYVPEYRYEDEVVSKPQTKASTLAARAAPACIRRQVMILFAAFHLERRGGVGWWSDETMKGKK